MPKSRARAKRAAIVPSAGSTAQTDIFPVWAIKN
jgi:hypothetical protein